MSPSTLPTPRQFLDSLLSSLPPLPSQPTTQASLTPSSSTNPLKSLDQAHRNLLLTLHMIYPSLLLHSLDLLDRGLVTKITQTNESTTENRTDQPLEESSPALGEEGDDLGTKNSFYLIHSAQTPTHPGRRSRSSTSSKTNTSSSPKTYHVHLAAWNCSCAAFVFSAFPPISSTSLSTYGSSQGDNSLVLDGWRAERVGGVSFDGLRKGDGKDGGVAMCKHLLACLLVERWGGLGGNGYGKKRGVRREEMAGMGADV